MFYHYTIFTYCDMKTEHQVSEKSGGSSVLIITVYWFSKPVYLWVQHSKPHKHILACDFLLKDMWLMSHFRFLRFKSAQQILSAPFAYDCTSVRSRSMWSRLSHSEEVTPHCRYVTEAFDQSAETCSEWDHLIFSLHWVQKRCIVHFCTKLLN